MHGTKEGVCIYNVSWALRELNVALCRGNASLCQPGAYAATRASGRTLKRGRALLSAEVAQACFATRMWAWGSWFGLTLGYVALLCAVYVQLHPVLFPAGGNLSSVPLCGKSIYTCPV
jgi:hypothetical protein